MVAISAREFALGGFSAGDPSVDASEGVWDPCQVFASEFADVALCCDHGLVTGELLDH